MDIKKNSLKLKLLVFFILLMGVGGLSQCYAEFQPVISLGFPPETGQSLGVDQASSPGGTYAGFQAEKMSSPGMDVLTKDNTEFQGLLEVQTGPNPTIRQYYPFQGSNGKSVDIYIFGDNFRDGIQVILTKGDNSVTGVVTSQTPMQINCTLPLKGAPAGIYNLTVLNTDGTSFTNPYSFRVNQASSPVILSVTPGFGLNNANISTVISGSFFLTDASVKLSKGNSNLTGSVVNCSMFQILCTFPLTHAQPGIYTLTVTNYDGGSGTKSNAFTVLSSNLTFNRVTPTFGYNSGICNITISGTNFRAGVQVNLTKNSVSRSAIIKNVTDTKIDCTLFLAGFSPGSYTLTITNSDGTSVNARNAFTVRKVGPKPTMTTFSPASGYTTKNLTMIINGTHFRSGATACLIHGSVIKDAKIIRITSNRITCYLSLNGLVPGKYNLMVKNPDGTWFMKNKAFTVMPPGKNPVITLIAPASGLQSKNTNVIITGTNFRVGAVVQMVKGSITKGATIKTLSAKKITCILQTKRAEIGKWNVKITNVDGTAFTKSNAFTVKRKATDSETGAVSSSQVLSPELSGGIAMSGNGLFSRPTIPVF